MIFGWGTSRGRLGHLIALFGPQTAGMERRQGRRENRREYSRRDRAGERAVAGNPLLTPESARWHEFLKLPLPLTGFITNDARSISIEPSDTEHLLHPQTESGALDT